MEHRLDDEINKQSQIWAPGVFRCEVCANYKGDLVCEQRIFIAFVGANLTHCLSYTPGKKCRHCGKIT